MYSERFVIRTLFLFVTMTSKFHLSPKMELTRENFRAMIYYDFRHGLSQQQCIDQLASTFGDEAPSKTTVYHWFSEFNRGRRSLTDEFKEGRQKSVVLPENIDAVRELIMQDRHVTYREIKASLGISMTSIHKILYEHLAVKEICPRWIPHNLTIDQKRLVSIGAKKCLKNTIMVRQKPCITSTQVTNLGSMRMSPKANSSRRCGCSKMSQTQQKLFAQKALRSKWSPVFLGKMDM